MVVRHGVKTWLTDESFRRIRPPVDILIPTTVWAEVDAVCSGLGVGPWKLCARKIAFAEISFLETVVLCTGSSQGYGPLIQVTTPR